MHTMVIGDLHATTGTQKGNVDALLGIFCVNYLLSL